MDDDAKEMIVTLLPAPARCPQNNALFDAEMTKQFIKHGSTMVKAKDSKTLITTLSDSVF
jgi:hypothetical protein